MKKPTLETASSDAIPIEPAPKLAKYGPTVKAGGIPQPKAQGAGEGPERDDGVAVAATRT